MVSHYIRRNVLLTIWNFFISLKYAHMHAPFLFSLTNTHTHTPSPSLPLSLSPSLPLSLSPSQAGHGQPLWVVLADYPGEEEGTVRVWQRDLVEVIDISRNEWCLVRPVVRAGEEGVEEGGWVPAGFLKPYSGGGFGEC